jgi:citrate synthase
MNQALYARMNNKRKMKKKKERKKKIMGFGTRPI